MDVCRNALLSDHEVPVLTDLSKEQGTIPNFWSRESIGAALQNLAWSQETMSLSSDSSLYIDTQNNDLTQYKQSKTIKPNEELKTKCGITFVENPIIRFVTGSFIFFLYVRIDFYIYFVFYVLCFVQG